MALRVASNGPLRIASGWWLCRRVLRVVPSADDRKPLSGPAGAPVRALACLLRVPWPEPLGLHLRVRVALWRVYCRFDNGGSPPRFAGVNMPCGFDQCAVLRVVTSIDYWSVDDWRCVWCNEPFSEVVTNAMRPMDSADDWHCV